MLLSASENRKEIHNMKKIFAIIMTICLLASALCVTALAAEAPAADIALCISGQKKDGTTVKIEDHKDLADGWSQAIKLAEDNVNSAANTVKRVRERINQARNHLISLSSHEPYNTAEKVKAEKIIEEKR